MHAAASADALIRTLFGLESTWPPYHDGLSAHLPQLETAIGWPAGYLSHALLQLVRDGDPVFQQRLEERVERLMTSRGIAHEWACRRARAAEDAPIPSRSDVNRGCACR